MTFDELQQLLATLDEGEHRQAIEADLIAAGTRLRYVGTDELMWHELYAVVKHSSAASAFYRAQQEEDAPWGLAEMLLAEAVDSLNVANWLKAGGKKKDQPKPITRPGVGPKKIGGKSTLPLDEMAAFLGWDTGGDN